MVAVAVDGGADDEGHGETESGSDGPQIREGVDGLQGEAGTDGQIGNQDGGAEEGGHGTRLATKEAAEAVNDEQEADGDAHVVWVRVHGSGGMAYVVGDGKRGGKLLWFSERLRIRQVVSWPVAVKREWCQAARGGGATA